MSNRRDAELLADVGQRIRKSRLGQGLRLKHLARLSGISPPALSLIETAKRDARLTTLARIAMALRVPLSSLVEDKPVDGADQISGSIAQNSKIPSIRDGLVDYK